MKTKAKQKATFPTATTDNGRMRDGEKEQVAFYAVVAKVGREFIQPVTARVWYGRSPQSSVAYASIWADGPKGSGLYFAGNGRAGGGGYCKRSASIGAAIRSAGIILAKRIDGVGESAIVDALLAIARAAGYRSAVIVRG